jgi:hypothetical protein
MFNIRRGSFRMNVQSDSFHCIRIGKVVAQYMGSAQNYLPFTRRAEWL